MSTQNGQTDLLYEHSAIAMSCTTTLQEQVGELVSLLQMRATSMQHLQIQAYTLTKKRRTRTEQDRTYWMARGRQGVFERVSHHLQTMIILKDAYTLYLALQEYLAILTKCSTDADVEKREGAQGIEQWKAEGEAQEFPKIAHALSKIVRTHIPDKVAHILSLDGNLVAFSCLHTGSGSPPD